MKNDVVKQSVNRFNAMQEKGRTRINHNTRLSWSESGNKVYTISYGNGRIEIDTDLRTVTVVANGYTHNNKDYANGWSITFLNRLLEFTGIDIRRKDKQLWVDVEIDAVVIDAVDYAIPTLQKRMKACGLKDDFIVPMSIVGNRLHFGYSMVWDGLYVIPTFTTIASLGGTQAMKNAIDKEIRKYEKSKNS